MNAKLWIKSKYFPTIKYFFFENNETYKPKYIIFEQLTQNILLYFWDDKRFAPEHKFIIRTSVVKESIINNYCYCLFLGSPVGCKAWLVFAALLFYYFRCYSGFVSKGLLRLTTTRQRSHVAGWTWHVTAWLLRGRSGDDRGRGCTPRLLVGGHGRN